MGTQQFCLKWNNHQLNMLSVFDHLLQSEAFVDVTLACEGSSLKAHKMVLSACSPYFQNLFMENPCQHPIVILKDIQYNDMKSIIDFMYKGEVNVSQEQLSALLKTADTLKVKGLAEVSGQVTQSPVPEASLQQQPQQPPSTQQQTPVPSKSPTPKRKRRQGAPASPSAINTNHSNSRSSSSTPQPIIQSAVSLSASASSSSSSSSSSLPKATHNDDSAGSSSDHRHHSKMKKVDDSNFDDVNDLVVPHLKEERLEEDSNDVDDLIMEASQEHIEIDTDPSIMPYSNDGMDQENVSPMRNDSYPHSVSIPSTSQSGSNAEVASKPVFDRMADHLHRLDNPWQFATRLAKLLFTEEERVNLGANSLREPHNLQKLEYIRNIVFMEFHVDFNHSASVWSRCMQAISWHCQYIRRKFKEKKAASRI
ncbi:hypothetical protein CHUAL_002398 [Chamberlinius hualienensis]